TNGVRWWRRLFRHHVPRRGFDRDRPDQRGYDRRPARHVSAPGVDPHFIHRDMRGDVAGKRQHAPLAPVLMDDIELQRVAIDPEVLQRAEGIRVVAPPAGQPEQRAFRPPDDEILLVHAGAETDPDPDYIVG